MVGSTVFVGWPWAAAYSAAKAGMDAFAYALRRELGPNGMHVAAVHPGGTPARKRDGFRAALAGSDDRFAALRPAGAPAARQR